MKISRAATFAKKIMMVMVVTFLAAAIFVSGFQLRKISAVYLNEAATRESLTQYRPGDSASEHHADDSALSEDNSAYTSGNTDDASLSAAAESADAENAMTDAGGLLREKVIVNQSIVDLRDEVNPDVVGWLTIPDTRIDYPFALGDDNSYYLGRDMYGNDAVAGTLFMDCRCSADLSDFNTIIYGHNMKNNSMFGDLSHFADTWFFENNRRGTIFLDDGTYTLEIFAYMVVSAEDKVVYDPMIESAAYYKYAAEYARNYRAPAVPSANVVTLSTCGYEFSGARIVLLANVV